ncbi:magnesium and cobalt transport protein CorA [Streptomyces sp. NPDC088354]|uniref:magnesium and cobalt transport protein CorA n=1 Tax=unclassified Streptomyces TaxID=2593676 RepID=UPI0029B61B62|nr:magnesium and cobalt transport protein CorA [Streptomyces sp. MI02-7b]MDX3071061.1 magnesium and cobalt transport protein CorA [Streptomyces sp. MI02-7b]
MTAPVPAPRPDGRPVPVVDCALYEDGERRPGLLPLTEAMGACHRSTGSFVWIGLREPTVDQLQVVADAFGLHPLAVEDAVHAHQRPKLERYGDTLFLVLKTAAYVEHDRLTPTSEVVSTGQIMIFAGPDFAVVVRHGDSPDLRVVRRQLEAEPELLAHGPAAVVHAIADTVVDGYLEVIRAVEADVEQVEADVFSPERTDDAGRIYQLKREMLELRRAVLPLALPLRDLAEGRVPGCDPEIRAYLRDVRDHLDQASERITGFVELLDSVLSANLAQLGIQQSTDLRRISAWAAIIAVPTMIVGIYGMNFDHMPELRWTFGYPLVLVVIVIACTLTYRSFRRNDWL